MSQTSGDRLGVYEIIGLLGAGGMGEVYRARDTRLKREVAIKILPETFAQDADRLARFQREAELLASLNHPNIAGVFGLEQHALVLELVEGETLAERVARGPLPLDEALPIARQIAEALEAAHERGIIHRDLKPANIKITPDGKVKVLDFGLAKLGETSDVGLSQSPTITSPAMMTGGGVILGTAAYMSPEQARGKTVDKRTDIWAFGCVLYEMLAGRQTFDEGDTVSDAVAAILKNDVDWSALPADTPAHIRMLLRRCLQKDPQKRLPHIDFARIEIDEASAEPLPLSIGVDTRRHTRRAIAMASALSAIAAIAVTVLVSRAVSPHQAPVAGSVTRLELDLPPEVELYTGGAETVALSPDGTLVAFGGVLKGIRQIYLRRFDQFQAVALKGTENVTGCFFSPDGRTLGFVSTGGGLRTISLSDGLVVPLADDVNFNEGGAWGADDRLTFVRAGTLWQVPATGGAATQLTRLDQGKGELRHRWPTAAAGGKVLLFTVVTGNGRGASHIEALTVATGQRQVLVDPGAFPLYATNGPLIFFRNDALVAAAFDLDRLAVTGPPARLIENLTLDGTGVPIAALSSSGALVYPTSGQARSQIVSVSRQGLEQPVTGTTRSATQPRMAPNGRQVLVNSIGDLWIADTVRATMTRLTSNETAGNTFAVWTPDGGRVVFRTPTGLQWIDTNGSGRSQAIPDTSASDYPNSVSPDGTMLAFARIGRATSGDVYVLSLNGEPHPHPIVTGSAYEGGPQFSPDGRWLAYVSDESGQFEVYVRPFPGPDRRWPVSTLGGNQPRWNQNGKELFYRDGNKMMVVDVSAKGPDIAFSPPKLLFEQRYAYGASVSTPNYDVSPDGQRFVMVKDHADSGRLNVVLNWFEELKQRVQGK